MYLREDTSVENDGFVLEGIEAPYIASQYYRRPPGWRLASHMHTFYQLIFITDGVLHVECAQGSFDVGRGQVHIMPPLSCHTLSSQGGFKQLGVDIDPNSTVRELAPLLTTYIPEAARICCQELLDSISEIAGRMQVGNRISMARVVSLLDDLVLRVLEIHTQAAAQRFDHRFSKYVNDHLGERLILSDFAREFHLSAAHLERLVRLHFNSSVMGLCNQRRLDRARMLLEVSDTSVNDIAEILGFHDTAHFSTFFKQRTGKSPTSFRHSIQGNHPPIPTIGRRNNELL
jgi:AraC-like DNA-binding protein/quercetin dioxygenase-like cupin family protein